MQQRLTFVVATFFASSALCVSFAHASEGALRSRPVVLIYAGKPVCEGCEEPLVNLIQNPKTQALADLAPRVKIVRKWAHVPRELQSLPPHSVFLIPGTDDNLRPWAQGESQAMTPKSIRAIQTWIQNGGSYAGICGGAIVAQKSYQDEAFSFPALNIAPVEADNFPLEDAKERLETVRWLPSGLTFGAYFQAGSFLTLLPTREKAKIWGKYLKSEGPVPHPEGVAAAQFSYGKGKVFLSGVHLEATRDFWSRPPAEFVPHTELLEEVLAGLIQEESAPGK